MFHSNTERLIDYWRERKIDRLSPLRASIEPGEFTDLLPQVFILGRKAAGEHLFRLAGGLLTDLHQRDLRQADFVRLWAPADRPRLSAAIETARREAEPVVAIAEARASHELSLRIEILLAPLRADGSAPDRFLGLYQPIVPLAALRAQPVAELGLIRLSDLDQAERFPPLRLAAVDGHQIA
jgi:hypothetical protein